jgi:hypothetical protein
VKLHLQRIVLVITPVVILPYLVDRPRDMFGVSDPWHFPHPPDFNGLRI